MFGHRFDSGRLHFFQVPGSAEPGTFFCPAVRDLPHGIQPDITLALVIFTYTALARKLALQKS